MNSLHTCSVVIWTFLFIYTRHTPTDPENSLDDWYCNFCPENARLNRYQHWHEWVVIMTVVCLGLNWDIVRYRCEDFHINLSNCVVNKMLEHIGFDGWGHRQWVLNRKIRRIWLFLLNIQWKIHKSKEYVENCRIRWRISGNSHGMHAMNES
jgi:hypothetical protein